MDTVYNLKWTESEKKLSRRLFEATLDGELAEVMAEFKAKAAAVTSPQEMWAIRDYLSRKGHEIEQKYDYRYSPAPVRFRQARARRSPAGGATCRAVGREALVHSAHRLALNPSRLR